MLRVIRDGTNERLRRPGRLTPSLFPIAQRRQINLYKGRKFFLRQPRSRAQHFNRLRVDLGYSGRLASPSNGLIVLLHACYQISKQLVVHCVSYQF